MAVKSYKYIEDDLADLVAKVSISILPELQEAREAITGVYFQFGTLIELQETIVQQTQLNGGVNVFPLVFMFVDVTEPRGFIGDYADLRLRLAILNFTDRTFKAKDRLENNYKPIIMPIYNELMRQITLSKFFIDANNVQKIKHKTTRRYYWGRESENGNTANKTAFPVDGLEISDLELKYYLQRCD